MILPKEKLLRWRRNDPRDWAKYKKLRNTINKNIKTSKASYYSNAFGQSEGNPRKTRQTIRAYLPSHQQYNGERTEVGWLPILVTFLMLFMSIFQQLGAALPMTFVQIIIIIWCYDVNVRPPVRTDAGGGGRELDVSPSGKEYVIAEVKFSISSNSLVSAVNHMAARTFREKKKQQRQKRVFLSTKSLVSTFA